MSEWEKRKWEIIESKVYTNCFMKHDFHWVTEWTRKLYRQVDFEFTSLRSFNCAGHETTEKTWSCRCCRCYTHISNNHRHSQEENMFISAVIREINIRRKNTTSRVLTVVWETLRISFKLTIFFFSFHNINLLMIKMTLYSAVHYTQWWWWVLTIIQILFYFFANQKCSKMLRLNFCDFVYDLYV